MSWLDDLRAPTSISSNRQLARAMLDHEIWPAGEEITQVALANQLNSANRGERLEWWLDGRGQPLFQVLAATLEIDELRLREAFAQAGGAPADRTDVFRFDDFSGLKPLDLRNEEPPPWIPRDVQRGQHGTWWHAAPGSGRTLVGRWLEVHEGWTFVQGDRWADVLRELPAKGSIYVELNHASGVPDLTTLSSQSPDRTVVVACPEPASSRVNVSQAAADVAGANVAPGVDDGLTQGSAGQPSHITGDLGGWAEVRLWSRDSSPLAGAWGEDWVSLVLDWVEERVLPGGGLDLARVREELGRDALDEVASSPGELLLFLGLLDEVGTGRVFDGEDTTVGRRIGRAWWRSVLKRLESRAPELLAPIKQAGIELVVQAEAARLAGGHPEAIDADRWAALLPKALIQPEVDDALIEALRSEDPEERARAIDAVRRPSPAEFVDALRAAGVLRQGTAGLCLGPALVVALLQSAALGHLLHHNPAGLGVLLLHADQSADALDILLEAAQDSEWVLLGQALDAVDAATPSGAALLDGVARVVGWTALELDAAPPPVDLCARLWEAQQPLLFQRFTNRAPRPLLQVTPDADRVESLTQPGIWFLCRLGLSWVLHQAGSKVPESVDNPWAAGLSDEDRERLAAALTEGVAYLRSGHRRLHRRTVSRLDPGDQTRIAVLGSRLWDAVGGLRPRLALLEDWFGPTVLCEAAAERLEDEQHLYVAHEVAGWVDFPMRALEAVAKLRGVALESVLAWAARDWVRSRGQGPLFRLPERNHHGCEPNLPLTRRLWRSVPPELFDEELTKQLPMLESVWPWLTKAQWRAVFALVRRRWWDRNESVLGGMLVHVPVSVVLDLFRQFLHEGAPNRFYRGLWQAHAAVLLGHLDEAIGGAPPPPGGHSHLAQVLYAAPADQVEGLVQRVERWLESPALVPQIEPMELRRWLAFVIEGRAPGWERAWGVMAR